MARTHLQRLPRFGGGVIAAALIAALVVGAAASIGGVSALGLGAGAAAVQSCDSNGVTASYTINLSTVQSVTVSGIAAACAGGSLRVTLTNSSGTSIGAGGPQTISLTSETVPISPQPATSAVAGVHVSVVGP